MNASDFVYTIENAEGEKLLEIRNWAEHNFKNKQTELKVQTFRAQKGMNNTLGEAHKENDFANFYLFRVNQEIEKRKMTISKNEINVKENHGIIQQGNYNTANQDFSVNLPIPKQIKKSAVVSFVIKFWWAFIIPVLAGIILLAIEYKWFK